MAKSATMESPEVVAAPTVMDQIAQLQAQLKQLKSESKERLEEEARESFRPLQDQVMSAVAAIGNDENGERAALALRWLGDNFKDYRQTARAYHKVVLGVAAVRKPTEPSAE